MAITSSAGIGQMSDTNIYPCDICNSVECIEVPDARHYTKDQPIHICTNCGFVYVRERRSAQAIADSWSKELYGDHYQPNLPSIQARHRYVATTLAGEVPLAEKKVLDIGAGQGQFLKILKDEFSADVFGIEPSEANCSILREKSISAVNGTIESYSEQGGASQFDVVTIMWTLETCHSCKSMIQAANKLLKPGGRVLVATGSRILVPFKKPLFDYLNAESVDIHPFRFSANTLTGLLAENGFSLEYRNRYLDSDVLLIIGRKEEAGVKISWEGDNPEKVAHFFSRWHQETKYYE